MGLCVRFQFPVGRIFSHAGAVAQMDRPPEWGQHPHRRAARRSWDFDDDASWCGRERVPPDLPLPPRLRCMWGLLRAPPFFLGPFGDGGAGDEEGAESEI